MDAPSETVRVLLVDDEPNVLKTLGSILRKKGFEIDVASSATMALEKLDDVGGSAFDVVLTDLQMPGIDGHALLQRVNERWPRLPVIILTGFGSIRTAIETTRSGAFEYLVKPASPEEIVDALRRAGSEVTGQADQGTNSARSQIVGNSRALRKVLEMVDRIGDSHLPVFLVGESGTGKELIARAIHEASARASGPFIPINCAALNPTLAESTFFGHRKGSFTGADENRVGVFQAARGGTLFLDEVTDFPISAQGIVLRALQEGAATPVGATEPEVLDVRVVCATNRDIGLEVREGRFRQDLYFRVNTIEIALPALRERLEDIPELVQAFLSRNRSQQKPSRALSSVLLRHDWPGNVRELRNVIERASVMSATDTLEPSHLPAYLLEAAPDKLDDLPMSRLDLAEMREIRAALSASGGEKKAAAERLGIDRKRLYRKMRRLGLD